MNQPNFPKSVLVDTKVVGAICMFELYERIQMSAEEFEKHESSVLRTYKLDEPE